MFHLLPWKAGSGVVALYRVSTDDAEELRRMLADHELAVSTVRKYTGAAIYEILTVSVASGGAVTALVHVLHKFLDLRRDKSFYIETENGLKVMTKGASIDEVERAVRAVSEYALGERGEDAELD